MTELTLKQSCSVRYKPIQKATPERRLRKCRVDTPSGEWALFLIQKHTLFLGEKVTMTQASLQNPIIPGHNCTFRRQIRQIIMA